MNRSYSKIRHIQEANISLEKRMLKEQSPTPPNPVPPAPNPAPPTPPSPNPQIQTGTSVNTKTQLVGKTITFYTNEQDAINASKSGQNNPSSKGSVIGKITRVEPNENSYLIIAEVEYQMGRVFQKQFQFDRTKGYFIDEKENIFFQESLKNILLNQYLRTDIASTTQKNNTTA